MKPRKVGRPRTPKNEYRGEHIFCRMTKSEAQEVKSAASKAKLSKSDWVRQALLSAARQAPPQA